jgi:hypothetical protein
MIETIFAAIAAAWAWLASHGLQPTHLIRWLPWWHYESHGNEDPETYGSA